jgi:hypothetical protein
MPTFTIEQDFDLGGLLTPHKIVRNEARKPVFRLVHSPYFGQDQYLPHSFEGPVLSDHSSIPVGTVSDLLQWHL